MRKKDKINLILEESKLSAKEISDYSKFQIQAFSIFFVFTGVAFNIGFNGGVWSWIIIQSLIPLFLFAFIEYEQNIMINSILITFNEKRVNKLANFKLLFWQSLCGYVKIGDLRKTNLMFYIAPLVTIIICLIVYIFPVYHIYKYLLFNREKYELLIFGYSILTSMVYLIVSIIVYLITSISLILIRTKRIERIHVLINEFSEHEITGTKKRKKANL